MINILAYVAIGILAGAVMGFFGIAGGIIVIPGLMLLAGFSQKVASGTNLLVLLIPVSIAAAIEYYRAGNTNLKAAVIIGAVMCIAAWLSSKIALKLDGGGLRLSFGIFIILMGAYIVFTSKVH
jgi:uncharacterized protein